MLTQLKRVGETFRRELTFYRFVVADPRTPKLAKWLLGLALGYAISPIDLIPDFIPVVGYLDDVLIVPALIILAPQDDSERSPRGLPPESTTSRARPEW